MRKLIVMLALVACEKAEPKATSPAPLTPAPPAAKPVKAEPGPPTFERKYGPLWVDEAYGVAALRDGGYALCGHSEKVDDRYKNDYDALIVRVDAAGERLWSEALGELEKPDAAEAIAEAPGGELVVVGVSKNAAWAFALDEARKTLWNVPLAAAPSKALALAIGPGGDLFVAGAVDGDLAVWKLSARGEITWHERHGTAERDAGNGIVVLADGGVAVSGYTYAVGAGDARLVRLDASGKKAWERTYGGATDDWAEDVAALPGGGFALAGVTTSKGAGGRDGWLIVTAADGALTREHTYGSAADDTLFALLARPGGGYALAGFTRASGLREGWLVVAAADGALASEKIFTEHNRRAAYAIAATHDGGYVLAGDWASFNSNYGNFWLYKGRFE